MSIDIQKIKNRMLEDRAVDNLVFRPELDHQRCKSAFWSHFATNGLLVPPVIDLPLALKFGGDRRVSKWWDLSGFPEWFSNQDEFRQRLEFLANHSLDKLEALLSDEKANANAKVAAIKLIMELSKKVPSKSDSEQFLDKKISGMGKKELEDYIRSSMGRIVIDNDPN